MGRSKLYDKRFHFWGPAELDARARALAHQRSAAGERTTSSDVLREAITLGLQALESGARYAQETPGASASGLLGLDPDAVAAATEVIDGLVDLGDVLHRLDVDALKVLADLDTDVLRALSHLDPESLDTLALLDMQPLVDLGMLDVDSVVPLADAVAERAVLS